MAYAQLEELTSRKREKVALFFTAEHVAGVLAVGLPAYLGTLGTTFWLRLVILLAAAVLGVLITSDMAGMAGYERGLWWVRGRLRRRLTGGMLRPAEFTAAPAVQGDRAVPLGGPIRRLKGHAGRRVGHPTSMITARTALRPREPGARAATAGSGQAAPADAAGATVVMDGAGLHGEA